jgi:cytochrome c oxidase cbb3-type subunit III
MEMFLCSINNPLAIMMIVIMFILLLVIGLLANVLLGAASFYKEKVEKEEAEEKKPAPVALMITALLLGSFSAMAQDGAAAAPETIGGLSKSMFYLMTGVIFLEITVILVMLANVRILIAKQKQKKARQLKPVFNWWSKMNKFRPAHEEVQIDLGHSYDGIRELDNRLPPWWLYGFYVTIIFAGIYLWRYHISHSAPSSQEEYQIAMVKAEEQKEAYLKKAAANIDENTVKLLTQAADIQAGKTAFESICAACHGKSGEGMVGPNLTDEYWLHGGSVKDIFKTIKYGVPEKGMKSWKEDFSPKQLAQLSSYIKSLKGTNPPNAKEKQGELYKETAVTDSVKVIAANTNK